MSKGDSGIEMPMCGPWCPMVTWEGRDPHLNHMCLCFRVMITCDIAGYWSHVSLLITCDTDHMWHCWSHVTLRPLVFFVCWSLCMLTLHMLAQWVATGSCKYIPTFFSTDAFASSLTFFCTHAFAASVVDSSEGGNAIPQYAQDTAEKG